MPDISVGLNPELGLILSPCINFIILVFVGYLGVRSTNKIALDIIEEADRRTNFKDFMMNVLTQAGVVSALLLSIEIPMVQLEVPMGFTRGTVMWDVYFGTSFLSTGFSVQGVCCSVLALAYIQGLNSEECLNFLAHSPDSIGFAIGSMATAAYLLIIQTTIYFVITSSSYYMVIYVLVASVICIFNITTSWKAFSAYRNEHVSPEDRRARRDFLGLGISRSWADWLSSCFQRPQNPVKAHKIGFQLGETSRHTVSHGDEAGSQD